MFSPKFTEKHFITLTFREKYDFHENFRQYFREIFVKIGFSRKEIFAFSHAIFAKKRKQIVLTLAQAGFSRNRNEV
jgi:hypothetical protein